MTPQEEEVYRAERARFANNDLDVIQVDEANAQWIAETM